MLFHLDVVHRNDDYTKQIEAENSEHRKKAIEMQRKINELEFHYKSLANINMELVDRLRDHGITFRDLRAIADPYWK